jgi:glycosyltransferase involved in cell wall biosynthesis
MQSDLPRVSVVVPAYRAVATVGEALASAAAQTLREIEIVVVDDGSDDGTDAVVGALAARDPRIRLLRQENRGVSAARNAGIRAARGEYVAFLDADDLWHPEKLERQLARFGECGPDVGLVYTWSTCMDGRGRILPGRAFTETAEGDVYARLLLGHFVNGTHMVRRRLLLEVGGYDEELGGNEDMALYLDLAERCRFAVVPECLAGYRLSPESLSHRVWEMRRCHARVRERARVRHPELPAAVFRWSAGNALWFLAFRALRSGRPRTGALIAAETFLHDPGFALRRDVLSIPDRLVDRLLGRPRESARPPAGPFLDGGPPPRVEPRRCDDPVERRRLQAVMRMRIGAPARPAAGGGGELAAGPGRA